MLGLKQFRHEGCLSYVVFDRDARAAVVIDPRADLLNSYREFVSDRGLKLVLALDTHIHADHFSGSHLIRSEFGSEIGMSDKSSSSRPSIRYRHGDRIQIGTLSFEVLETPGHTPDSICFYGQGMVFTGDTLLIGGSGRTDFPGSDPAAQWTSIHQTLGALPVSTLVMPGHDYNDLIFSTIEVERMSNAHWKLTDIDQFVALKNSEVIPHLSVEVRARVAYNQAVSPNPPPAESAGSATACGVPFSGGDRFASINVEKYFNKLKERAVGTLFIDVRELDEFEAGHILGTSNIPLSEVGFHLADLMKAKRVYVSCLSGRRSALVAKTLSYLGHSDVVNVTGGFKSWQKAGYPIAK